MSRTTTKTKLNPAVGPLMGPALCRRTNVSDGQHEGWHETRDRKYPLKPKPEPKKEPVTVLLPVKQINLVRSLTGLEGEATMLYLLAESMREAGLMDLLKEQKSDTLRLDVVVSWVMEEKDKQLKVPGYDHLPGIEDTGQGA